MGAPPVFRLRPVFAAFLIGVWPLPGPWKVQGQEGGLAGMTDTSFAKWVPGTQWKGQKDGRDVHVWFATPGMAVWRWKYAPGLWDCRAVSYSSGAKGSLTWRWDAESPASCTLTAAEDLKSLGLKDGLAGEWTLQALPRKSAAVTGGRIATMAAGGFNTWLEQQSLQWRLDTLIFAPGGAVTFDNGKKGRYQIISPGVVEVVFAGSPADCLLVMFTPGMDGALVYAPWGVTGAKVKNAPPAAVIPAPVFNEPDPAARSLTGMSKEDFEKWLTGTEWEHTEEKGGYWHWFAAPGFVGRRTAKEEMGWGMEVTAPGKIRWSPRVDPKRKMEMTLDSSLATGEVREGKEQYRIRLIARRSSFPMSAAPVDTMAGTIPEVKTDMLYKRWMTYDPAAGKAAWHEANGKREELLMSIHAPGTAVVSWPNPGDKALLVFNRTATSVRILWKWGTDKLANSQSASPASAAADKGSGTTTVKADLGDAKAIQMKKQTAVVNALVVTSADGANMAGGLSRLSFTSLAVDSEAAATMKFNQTTGSDMSKALREVMRFHAIRHGGWPRGQKMELSFADKYSPKDGPSAAVACGLLLESALAGLTISPEFAVTGDLNADGSVQPVGGVAAKLRGATKGGCTRVAIPAKTAVQAADLALTDGAAPFLNIQIFSIDSFDDAVKLASGADPVLTEVLQNFTALAKRIKVSPPALRQPATIAALRKLAAQAPSHLSVRFLLAIAENKLPAELSPAGSLSAIQMAIVDALQSTDQDLLAKSDLDRGKVGAARSRLQKLRPKLDKRTIPFVDAWISWCVAVDRLVSASASGNRPEKRLITDLHTAIARVRTEETRLRSNTAFSEDLMKE